MLRMIREAVRGLSRGEWALWGGSAAVITAAFLLGEDMEPLTLGASLVGVTSLIFIAKGQPLGQALTVMFSLLYALVSWEFRYYGEMITYLFMTAPAAVAAVVNWLRHPFAEGKLEVAVAQLTRRQKWICLIATPTVTMTFYFVLRACGTANLPVSTLSVATSFLASYLTFCRSCAYALAYAANDVVLIVLWICAALQSPGHLPMALCFGMFLLNDLYAFRSWRRMGRRQAAQ